MELSSSGSLSSRSCQFACLSAMHVAQERRAKQGHVIGPREKVWRLMESLRKGPTAPSLCQEDPESNPSELAAIPTSGWEKDSQTKLCQAVLHERIHFPKVPGLTALPGVKRCNPCRAAFAPGQGPTCGRNLHALRSTGPQRKLLCSLCRSSQHLP